MSGGPPNPEDPPSCRRDSAALQSGSIDVAGLLTGLRMSIPYALIGAVIGELVALAIIAAVLNMPGGGD